MTDNHENSIRSGVITSLPEVNQIGDAGLREKVIDAWTLSLSQTEFTNIDEIRASGVPDSPAIVGGTQSDHIRGVALMAQGLANGIEQVNGGIGINRDLLWACALCHDVGKPYEFSPRNQERWRNNVGDSGYPAIRHSVYGVHICLTVGLPEAVAHAAGAHSAEGELIERSLENSLVHAADVAFWQAFDRAGLMEQ